MSITSTYQLPSSQIVRQQILAADDELKALRRLLRASIAAEKAEEARRRGLVGQAIEEADQ